MAANRQLAATVITPEGTLFEGNVVSLSSRNETGKFDVLPMHSNFISLVRDKIVLRLNRRQAKEITIKQGILYCRNNKVDVYVGTT